MMLDKGKWLKTGILNCILYVLSSSAVMLHHPKCNAAFITTKWCRAQAHPGFQTYLPMTYQATYKAYAHKEWLDLLKEIQISLCPLWEHTVRRYHRALLTASCRLRGRIWRLKHYFLCKKVTLLAVLSVVLLSTFCSKDGISFQHHAWEKRLSGDDSPLSESSCQEN